MNTDITLLGAGCFLGAIGIQRMVAKNMGMGKGGMGFSSSSGAGSSSKEAAAAAEERVKSSLYTRTGDKGFSSLYNGERRSKNDMIFHTLGHQDELNAVLGLAREHCARSNNGLEPM
jgi:hypothetical protein